MKGIMARSHIVPSAFKKENGIESAARILLGGENVEFFFKKNLQLLKIVLHLCRNCNCKNQYFQKRDRFLFYNESFFKSLPDLFR